MAVQLAAQPVLVDSIPDIDNFEEQQNPRERSRRDRANAFDRRDSVPVVVLGGRVLDSNFLSRLKQDPDFEYVNKGFTPPAERSFSIHKNWIYVVIFLFVVLLAWYLRESNVILFRKKPSAARRPDANKPGDGDIFSISFPERIGEAVAQGNFRLAVRLHYLQLLKLLSEKKVIHYQPDKTNYDYLMQVSATPFYTDFFNATRHFEYSWYGAFSVDEQQYRQMKQSFDHFYKTLHQ